MAILNEPSVEQSAAAECSSCGHLGPEDSAFCPKCGTSLDVAAEGAETELEDQPAAILELVVADPTEEVPAILPLQQVRTDEETTDASVEVLEPEGAAKRSWLRSRRGIWTASIGSLVLALALAAVAFVATRGESVDFAAGLTSAMAELDTAVEAAGEAENLAELSEAAATAEAASSEIALTQVVFESAGASERSVASTAVLRGVQSVLEEFAGLSEVEIDSASRFGALTERLERPLEDVNRAISSLNTTGLEVGLEAGPINKAAESADEIVEAAAAAFKDWETATADVRAKQEGDRTALASYEAAVRAQSSTYAGLREDLGSFIRRVDSGVTTSFTEGYETFAVARTKRQAVRTSLASATAPDSMAAAHAELLAVIDRSIDALESASEGLRQYEQDYWGYMTYKDTPGWKTFSSRSDRISGEWPTALAAWESRLGESSAAIDAVELPPKPKG